MGRSSDALSSELDIRRGLILIIRLARMDDIHTADKCLALVILIGNGEGCAGRSASVHRHLDLLVRANLKGVVMMSADMPQIGSLPDHAAGSGFHQRRVGILRLSTVVAGELIDINQFPETGLPLLTSGNQLNLTGRAGVDPSLDETPCQSKEAGDVDHNHPLHRFGEAEGIDLGLLLDDVERPLGNVRGRQSVQIQHANALEASELRIGLLVRHEAVGVVVHHHVPMIPVDAVEGGDALHPVHAELAGLGNEQGTAALGIAGIQLRILLDVNEGIDAEGGIGIGVEALLAGLLATFGRLLHHFDYIVVDEFARPEPAGEGPGLTLNLSEAVDRIFELTAALLHFVAEFNLLGKHSCRMR